VVQRSGRQYFIRARGEINTSEVGNGGDKKLFELAKSVGYDSDAAFSNAFKGIVGIAPRHNRRSATGAA